MHSLICIGDFSWKHPELVAQISIIKRQYIVVLRGSYFIARSIVVYKYSELRLDFDISNGYLEFESSRYAITFLICVSFFVLPIFKFYWLPAVLVWTFFWSNGKSVGCVRGGLIPRSGA